MADTQRAAIKDQERYSRGTDDVTNTAIAESKTPEVTFIGGVYRSTLPTYTANDNVIAAFDSAGRLITAVELNDYVDDAAFTVGTSKMLAVGGVATSDSVDANDTGAFRMTTARNLGIDIASQSATAVVISATAAANLTTNPIFAAITDGTSTVDVGVDEAAMAAVPQFVPVGGEYRASATTYTDGDAAILQTDVNGRLLVDAVVTLNDYTDDSNEFTVTTSKLLAIGGIATSDSVEANDVGAFRMTTARNLGIDIASQSATAVVVSATSSANAQGNPIFTAVSKNTTINSAANPINVLTEGWTLNANAKGTVGVELTITPASGTKQAFEVIVVAPLAADDAVLLIERDTTTLFNGYMANRDGNNAIKFPGGATACTTNWNVTVTGGSGDLFVLVRHN